MTKPTSLDLPATGPWTDNRMRRILELAGYDDAVPAVAWGDEGVTDAIHVAPVLLSSVSADAPIGLQIDRSRPAIDPTTPSDLEQLLAKAPLDDTGLLDRARAAIARLKRFGLSMDTASDPHVAAPDPGYVLVLDQPRASPEVRLGKGTGSSFRETLAMAQIENPGRPVYVLPCGPGGHYSAADAQGQVSILEAPICRWRLFDGAVGVYTISAPLGFEAILAGHHPRVFGQPFYGGWGLTQDEQPVARRTRSLTRAQLFAAVMILYPVWYDPLLDEICDLERALDLLTADHRAFHDDKRGYVTVARPPNSGDDWSRIFGRQVPVQSVESSPETIELAKERGMTVLSSSASRDPDMELATAQARVPLRWVEEGFLLPVQGSAPVSMLLEECWPHNDPEEPSRLEHLIAASDDLPDLDLQRAERVVVRLITLSDAMAAGPPEQPEEPLVAVLGSRDAHRDQQVVLEARNAHPDARILYRPEGLHAAIDGVEEVLPEASVAGLLTVTDAIWTYDSLAGFEALLRGAKVTCTGVPFYAGWGLTRDKGAVPSRRRTGATLRGLAHAALVDYPRYADPQTGQPWPVEDVLDHLEKLIQ
ncbi:MAG: capsular polysaccharide biosynthesis protein [Pseudomonadota bacterium]